MLQTKKGRKIVCCWFFYGLFLKSNARTAPTIIITIIMAIPIPSTYICVAAALLGCAVVADVVACGCMTLKLVSADDGQ